MDPHPRKRLLHTCVIGAVLAVVSCTIEDTDVEQYPLPKIIVKDVHGNEYDFAYAVYFYDFDLDLLSTGAGPDARPPIIDPEMIDPVQPGYPPDLATNRIVGTRVGNEARAYAITDIMRNEVVDDHFGTTPVTVAY